MRDTALVALLAATLLSGCAAPASGPTAAAPAVTASAAPPGATDRVDGTYRGTNAASGRSCGSTSGTASLTIRNRTVVRTYGPSTQMTATVQPDGTFAAQSGRTSMSGTVRGGHADINIGNEYCTIHQSLDKV